MATSITQIFVPQPYAPSDEKLLNASSVQSSFNPGTDYIEYSITTPDNSFSTIEYDYRGFSFPDSGVTSGDVSSLNIDPESDLKSQGFNSGEFIVSYNFLKNELSSSFNNRRFFVKEISSDRTEVTISTIDSPTVALVSEIENFKNYLNSDPTYFQDFFLNFGNNVLSVANNIAINNSNFDVYINLYSPLPSNINVKTSLWVVTQVAEELSFNISTTPDLIIPTVTSFPINGPNFNLPIKDQTNNSTDYQTYSSLITSSLLSTSYSQLNNLISSSGVQLGIDYTNFSNFIHFSSAITRINNFIYKVGLIEQYSASIAYTSSYFTGKDTTTNTSILTNQINNIIENFDGYEYYLYYSSGSWAYPKSNSTVPYTLYSTGSSQVTNWLGSVENLTGILGSASIYNQNNPDYLYNTVPNFIQEDPQNDPYKLFVEMVAQHYDNIWIYFKNVSNKYSADNRLDYGISKDLVAESLKSFGIKLYQNNFSSNDLYSAFLGYGNPSPDITGSLPVIVGSGQEYINNYITASYDASVMPLDDVNKETYKRLYHNLPYLAKTKGTIPGLRALINCFGIPDTILRISEFGGRDKDTSTYDYFDQQYNYALNITGVTYINTPLFINGVWNQSYLSPKPDSIQFRFKPKEYISTYNSQSLIVIRNDNNDYVSSSLLILEYTGSGYTSSSLYSGSTYSSSYAYANLVFYPKAEDLTISASVYQPFYNGDWWSVQLDRTINSNDTFTLYAGSKGYYDGYDGNQILHLASASVSTNTDDTAWKATSPASGKIDFGFNIHTNDLPNFIRYTGSLQEIRYWARTGSTESFKDFIMNPHSIDYDEEENEYANYLVFRAPLGSELDTLILGNNKMASVHPKVTGSWTTGTTSSFLITSDYTISGFTLITSSNIESYFYDQPIAGIKNRVTDKIQIVSSSYPTGSVLSQYRSLEQTYPTLGSETPDINLLEVAFSPQNEINNDIISSLGYFNIGEYIGDPRQVSSSATTYPDLVNLSNDFFQKYFASYNLFDYIRLIKYFDNSLFKMIQDFIPARTSLASGVVIKQHLLERNKYPQPQVEWEDVTYSGSITTAFIEGGTGGTFDSYNFTGSILPPTFINNTQSWGEAVKTPVGLLTISHSTQDEFYNGELPNSIIIATDGELNEANTFKYPSDNIITYNPTLYISNITNESTFTNFNTSPNPGEVFLWWDSGSLTNPGNTVSFTPSKYTIKNVYGGDYNAAYFAVNKTNGVKYIKLNSVDVSGSNQSDYLGQLETIILSYPDRSNVTYNIAGIQRFGDYFLYSIGPYAPGSMNNFNTSSVGDIKNYTLQTNQSFFSGTPGANILTASLTSTIDPLNYFNNTTHIYTLGNTPNIALQFELTASTVTSGNPTIYVLSNTPVPGYILNPDVAQGAPGYIYLVQFLSVSNGNSGQTSKIFSGSLSLLDSTNFIVGVSGTGPVAINTINFNIKPITPEFNGSSSLTILDPYIPNFDYNEYNPLLDNADIPQTSVFFMDVDYSQNPVTPVNQELILDGGADRAQVQDSNYTSYSWSGIRYNGSKNNSVKFN